MSDLTTLIYHATTWVLPALFAITFHEAAHGWVASKLGDDTARQAGRVSFNPLRHIDRFGTVILPGLLVLFHAPFIFGYAKPVPVDFRRLRQPKRDMVWVATAGPAINIALALACAFAVHGANRLPDFVAHWAVANLTNAFVLNVVLAVFNLLPLPPLDGGRILVGLLPPPWDRRLARTERWGMAILIGLLMLPPLIGMQFGVDLSVIGWLLGPVVDWLLRLIEAIAGFSA
ncbi:MAG: site-2 protease family protein [Alphaproteobacteria bacterium]|nr:site-2 protease family protein [Alphaproteobacteria bacterium]